MTIAESSAALGGRTARACDNCLLKRARWFCAADDAFLCQACDASVHSANQLAGRHHRVRLQTASFKGSVPGWQQRKARSRRRPAKMHQKPKPEEAVEDSLIFPVVPQMEELFPEEKDEHMVPRVPEYFILDDENGFNNEFCVEELLNDVGELFDEEMNGSEQEFMENGKRVKVEDNKDDEEVRAVIAGHFDFTIDKELMCWEFNDDYGRSIGEEAKEIGPIENNTVDKMDCENGSKVEKPMMHLRLNYEEIIDAWASQGSPWENGVRPIIDLNDFTAKCARVDSQPFEGARKQHHAEREARVSRYKEKRRTRLFSKKIRYQVRKLNAEQRPRIKGRFVKRDNFLESSLSCSINK